MTKQCVASHHIANQGISNPGIANYGIASHGIAWPAYADQLLASMPTVVST